MNPSNFTSHPYDSVLQNNESETVARNIMVILSKTGDKFRVITWEEYKAEREKDGHFSTSEKPFFEKVYGFCTSAESARAFCKNW